MNKDDFDGTIKWNRTNPWWKSGMGSLTSKFRYPLTCCPLNKIRDNWNKLPTDQLEQAAHCAMTGTNVYQIVRFFSLTFFRSLYFQGCYNKLIDLLNSMRTWVIIVAIAILILEVKINFLSLSRYFHLLLFFFYLVIDIHLHLSSMLSSKKRYVVLCLINAFQSTV